MTEFSWPRRRMLAAVSGALLSFAFWSLPFQNDVLVGLGWLGLSILLVVSVRARPGIAFVAGFLSGAAFYTLSLPWIYTVMRMHGGVPALPAAGVLAALVAAASLFPAVFSLGMAWLGRRSATRACLAAPFLWVALEFARTHLPAIGFPWNLLGYATGSSLPLLQIVSVTGIYGLSFLIAAWCSLVAYVLLDWASRREHGAAVILLSLLTVVLPEATALGNRWIPSASQQHVARLVQTNFPQSLSYPADWMENHAGELDELERLSVSGAPQSSLGRGPVIWPEVPAPFSLQDPRFAARAERIARTAERPLLVGIVDWKLGANGALAPYNSAALLDPSGRQAFLYDKIHLVPFGEYVPLRRWLTFARKMTAEVGEFQPGSEYKVGTLSAGGGTFGVFICYEAIFPDEVRRFVAHGAGLLVNLSNDGWFGRSAAPAQHLMMARVRAVENRRWLLRDTNNGFTVAVDPYGRYAAQLAPDVRGALDAPYGLRSDLTLYTRWGDWLAWLGIAGSVGFLLAGAFGSRRGAQSAAPVPK
jgi:apolipoprotein N-acyltransferase